MRDNSKLFEVYSNNPMDLLKLTRDLIGDVIRTFGLVIIVAPCGFIMYKKHRSMPWIKNLILVVIVPYILSILFLAHRSYPRYVLPFLPLVAIVGGFGIYRLEHYKLGRCFHWLILVTLMGWTIGFIIHLRQNPRDASKHLIRAAVDADVLPKNSTLCLFTKRLGTQYIEGPNHTWTSVNRTRDWFWEKYGWVSSNVRPLTLLPEQQNEVQRIRPELIGIFDSDTIQRPIQGYRKLYRFTNKFPKLYGYIYNPEEFELFASKNIKIKIFEDGSFY